MQYSCARCRDTGWSIRVDEQGYERAKECSCGKFQRERLESKLAFADIPEEFAGNHVNNFRTDIYSSSSSCELAEMAKIIAKNYVDKFDVVAEKGKGLYLFSAVKGSGKTRLAVSIANDLIDRGASVKFATTIQILDRIKSSWGDKVAAEQRLIADIVNVPVLIIDDIGVETARDWVNERFYNIINGRMIDKKVTIFTSNCRVENLRLDDRIVNRISKMALPVEFPNESVRLTLANQENEQLLNSLLS